MAAVTHVLAQPTPGTLGFILATRLIPFGSAASCLAMCWTLDAAGRPICHWKWAPPD